MFKPLDEETKRRMALCSEQISFITCVNDPEKYYESLATWPRGENIMVPRPKSMARGYNEGLSKSTAPIKCFIHQDVKIFEPFFVEKVKGLLEDFDLIGVLGASQIGMRWDVGRILIHDKQYAPRLVEYEECDYLDGLLLITDLPLEFDESNESFHFYDMDICEQVRRMGGKVACVDLLVEHSPDEGRNVKQEWEKAKKWFMNKWYQ